ncbi:MAG: PEP-CTERM system-associated, FemAB-related protein [Alcanivorax sp.]|uniref:FemAB family XrtA/PEP-CTERM system-associated protein n=1 Tax=unclassified Ketobacter TaxID=2639109 RepID=UPI000C8E0604|nr:MULTISPECIES: FemAB family XrtA/PEP-CTERM system-associated protein [unclassified Ketobacter]MAA58663.1 PEP-CTERM system-associated, FemAB-related protein [Pseudomonadales bacterium]MEC8813862.1 FemAB family XrtA/PEP-CTERM system-associated protein [Pseudomonadota bacterium]TNC90876.1 MAG: PEP-CTERM system-associated, FemAB-related protein [Alcanivorax sp.]RLT87820.1 MAG: FemAB family PEP-CTERM system-associated protein [Ketobacter sp. GenoA1]RLT96516.1 MAG: FemAB family PEP-CTERM system-as
MIGVRQVSWQDSSIWDQYVEQHPQATPYHLMAWGRAVEKAYGHRCIYLVAEQEGSLVGVLPLVAFSIPLLGTQLCSLPFCDLGGILSDNEQVSVALLQHLKQFMSDQRVKSADLRHTEHVASEAAQPGEKVRMVLPLEASAEQQFKQFKSKLRSQVRKAEKNGVVFLQGSSEAHRQAFYRVMQVNMHQLGSPVHSRLWFDSVLDCYAGRARLGLVEFEGKIVGGAIILLCGNTVTVPWASTLPEYNKLAPNMLLYWGLLSIAAEGGFKQFDFGRSTVDEGTYRFKKQWGACPVPLQWQVMRDQQLTMVESGVGGGMRDKVAEIWQALPMPLVNFFGPIVRRYISL